MIVGEPTKAALRKTYDTGWLWLDSDAGDLYSVIVVCRSGIILGYVAFMEQGRCVDLLLIESRHAGAGSALIRYLKEQYDEINAHAVQWGAVDHFEYWGFVYDGLGRGQDNMDAGMYFWYRHPKLAEARGLPYCAYIGEV